VSDHLFALDAEGGAANQRGAMEALEQRYAGFLLAMRDEARRVAARVGRVTTDDCRTIAKIKGLQEVDPHVWGGIFKEQHPDGRKAWRAVGNTKSVIEGNNGRLIRLWVPQP
jgi:hypothetical protein